jgi:hypothetical protein
MIIRVSAEIITNKNIPKKTLRIALSIHGSFHLLAVIIKPHGLHMVEKIESLSFSSAEIQHFRTENTRSD